MNSSFSSLPYYEHNAAAYVDRTRLQFDTDPLNAFVSLLPPHALVLDAGCGSGRDLKYFAERGFQAEGFDGSTQMVQRARQELGLTPARIWQADFMLLSLAQESYDGIWAHQVFMHFPPDGCRRIMATFFRALKPKGILFVSFEKGTETITDQMDDPKGPSRTLYRYEEDPVASLIRQNGFQLLSQGHESTSTNRFGFLAQRL